MKSKTIIARIYLQDSTPQQIAMELGVSRSAVSAVIAGNATSRRIASRIGDLLGTSPAVLWPARYEYKSGLRPAA